jgi:hypothetical protein
MVGYQYQKSGGIMKISVDVCDAIFSPLTLMLNVVSETLITSLGPRAKCFAREVV